MPTSSFPGSPLRLRAFRRVWAGATVSSAGDAASWIALVAFALGRLHASLPLLVVLYTAPVAVGGLVSGWALDRFDRRKLLIGDSLIRGIAVATVPLAAATGHLVAGQLYAVAAIYGALKMTSLAGLPALLPALVPDALLEQANALEGSSFGLASLTGSALAGAAIATVGPGWVIAGDACSYLLFALALTSVRLQPQPTAPAQRSARAAADGYGFGQLLRMVAHNPWLRNTTVMFAAFNVGDGALLVFLPGRAVRLGMGTAGYGWLVAATTGGELIAAAWLVRRRWHWPLPVSIVCAQVTAAVLIAALMIPEASVTVGVLIGVGMCAAPMTAWAQTLRMRAVPPGQQGKLFALLRTIMQATPPAGAAVAGLTIGYGQAVTVLAIAALMALPALLLARGLVAFQPAEDTPTPAGHRSATPSADGSTPP